VQPHAGPLHSIGAAKDIGGTAEADEQLNTSVGEKRTVLSLEDGDRLGGGKEGRDEYIVPSPMSACPSVSVVVPQEVLDGKKPQPSVQEDPSDSIVSHGTIGGMEPQPGVHGGAASFSVGNKALGLGQGGAHRGGGVHVGYDDEAGCREEGGNQKPEQGQFLAGSVAAAPSSTPAGSSTQAAHSGSREHSPCSHHPPDNSSRADVLKLYDPFARMLWQRILFEWLLPLLVVAVGVGCSAAGLLVSIRDVAS